MAQLQAKKPKGRTSYTCLEYARCFCIRTKAQRSEQKLKALLANSKGISLRLLVIDAEADPGDILARSVLKTVHVVRFDSKTTTYNELIDKVYEAHKQNKAPFRSICFANHGPAADPGAPDYNQWPIAADKTLDLRSVNQALDDFAPFLTTLTAALQKTGMDLRHTKGLGASHVDFLACNLASACKGFIPALEKMYAQDFRASTDETGNIQNGGNWKMETDSNYDAALDYVDWDKLAEYSITMIGGTKYPHNSFTKGREAQPRHIENCKLPAGWPNGGITSNHQAAWEKDVTAKSRKVQDLNFPIQKITHGGNRTVPAENWGITFPQFKDFITTCKQSKKWNKLKQAPGRNEYSKTYPTVAKQGKPLDPKGYVSAGDIVYNFSQQLCAGSGCGLWGVLNPVTPRKCTMMLSHSWAEDIEEVLNALERYFEIKKLNKTTTVIWFCCFALAQPEGEKDASMPTVTLQCKMDPPPFAQAIASAKVVKGDKSTQGLVAVHTGAKIISTEHPKFDGPDNMYNRLWCVYELWYARHVVGTKCYLCVSDNYLRFLVTSQKEAFKVNTMAAKCTSEADVAYIKGKISKGEIERKQPKDSDYRTMDEDATTVRNNLSVIREYVPKGVAAKCCQKDMTIAQLRAAESEWRALLQKKDQTAIDCPLTE